MADTYFAAEMMNQAIDMALKGLRDLRSVTLKPFYDQPEPVRNGYDADNYAAVSDPMTAAELSPPTQQEFATQLTPSSGSNMFIQLMVDIGVVLAEDAPDVISVDKPALPDMGDVSSFLTQAVVDGLIAIDMERASAIMAGLGLAMPPDKSLHIISGRGYSRYAELDPIVRRRMARMREYVRLYLRSTK